MALRRLHLSVILSLFWFSAFAQHTSARFNWAQIGEQKALNLQYFNAISVEERALTYQMVVAGMKVQSMEVIKAGHDFALINSLDITPEKAKQREKNTSQTCVASSRGKALTIVGSSEGAKGLQSMELAWQVLDNQLSPVGEATPLKQPSGGVIPVNLIDVSNPLSNHPFQLTRIGNDFVICYVLSEDAETTLNVGLARFDSDFNLIFNELHAIDMPANRLIDFRLIESEFEEGYYVLIKETTLIKPASKITMPTGPSFIPFTSKTTVNEMKPGHNRVYKFSNEALVHSYEVEGARPTPAIKVLSNGAVVIAGLNNDGKKGRYTGAYSITLNADLVEIARTEEKFSEMYSDEMESFKTKEKGVNLSVRNIKIFELGERLILNAELFGTQTIETVNNGRSQYTYNLIAGDNLLFQMNKDGGFTGKFATIPKNQLESGVMQLFVGAVVFEKEDVLHCYYNDRTSNLGGTNSTRWNTEDYRRQTSVIREVKMDADLNKLSDGAVTDGKDAIRMIAAATDFIDGHLLMFGMDGKKYYGTLVK